LKLREEERVTWSGEFRPALDGLGVYPRPLQQLLPVWIAVGGTPASVVRAGMLGLPMALAIIGGEPARFAPLVNLYRQAARRAGHDETKLPVSINSHGFVADSSQQAGDIVYPSYAAMMNKIGRERGWSPLSRSAFEASRSPRGALLVGSPEEVTEKILAQHEIFGHQRFLMQASMGSIGHKDVMHAIELFGTKVAPVVRKETEVMV
jgi:alkanesulfonate monooxygenase SsuD/methylene tetrahydromethanopterin reductase-like flavin-dependent oxidoreductase (luciferase family)